MWRTGSRKWKGMPPRSLNWCGEWAQFLQVLQGGPDMASMTPDELCATSKSKATKGKPRARCGWGP